MLSPARRKALSQHLVAAASVFLLTLPASAAGGEVEWLTSPEQAINLARETRRPLLMDFWADWCAPCRAMDREFWSRADVIERSRKLVCLRVDFDKLRPLAMKHSVSAIPAVVVKDPWGNSLAAVVGFGDTRQLENLLNHVPEDFSAIERWMAVLDRNGKDFTALRELGKFYYRYKFVTVSSHYFERALKTREAKADPPARADVLVGLGWSRLLAGESKPARQHFERALKDSPELPMKDEVLLGLVAANLALGRRQEAEAVFADLAARFPDSEAAAEARRRLEKSQ